MNKTIIMILLTLLISSSCKTQEKLNVDKVWEKFHKTVADKETVTKIKTLHKVIETKLKQDILESETYIKFPDKVYRTIKFDNEFTTYILNGNKGIVKGEDKQRKMNNDELIMYKDYAIISPETKLNTRLKVEKYHILEK